MKLFSILTLFVFLCWSCQKDNKKETKTESPIENPGPKSKPLDLSTKIGSAYNIAKFKAETKLRYSAEVKISDTLYFKGTMEYNISEKTLTVKTGQEDFSISNYPESTPKEQFLFQLNEIYTLPFNLKKETFKPLDQNDSMTTSLFKAENTKISYTLNTHPLTEIIQSLKTENATPVFDDATIVFNKYITVNRIPVSMLWEIYKDDEKVGEVKISRISYPKA